MSVSLLGSLLVFALGPAIYYLVERNRSLLDAIDGFVFVSVGGLVAMHLVPALAAEHALLVLAVGFLGFLGPNIFERVFHQAERSIHFAALYLAIIGLFLHAAVDGAAIAMGGDNLKTAILPIAIIIHRLPVGLTLWWLMRPRFSPIVCWCSIFTLCVATVVGYSLGEELFHLIGDLALDLVQAFVAGSVLHVVFFRVHFEAHLDGKHDCCSHYHEEPESTEPVVKIGVPQPVPVEPPEPLVRSWPESIGNALGLLLLIALFVLHSDGSHGSHTTETHIDTLHHGHHHHGRSSSFVDLFMGIALQSAPALVIAHLAAIWLYGFLPSGSLRWLGKGSTALQALKGVATGLPLPVCSCGILPFYRTLIKRGAPPAAAVAFLIATPELGIDAVLISVPLLGKELAILRVIAAFLLAFFVAVVIAQRVPFTPSEHQGEEQLGSTMERLMQGLRHSLIDLADSTGPWILFGISLAAFFEPLMHGLPTSLPLQLEILLFAAIGVVVYVCASGATPLAAIFIATGVSPGAAVAFLLTGPATNVSTFGVLKELHGKSVALLFGGVTAGTAVVLGYLVNFFTPFLTLPSTDTLMHHEPVWYETLSFSLIALLYLFTFIRVGGREFLKEIFGRGIR